MGRRTRGVEVPKIQTQSPFTGQFGHFCGPIGRKDILHSSPSTSPSPSLRYKKTGPRANTSKKNDEQQYYIISPNYDKQQYYFILPNSANHQYYFMLPNYANHSRFEWVNLFSGSLWWGCIYPVILKNVTTPAPPLYK